MANKEDIQLKINAAVESAEAAKSLGQLKKSLLEIQTLQASLGETSGAQFDKLTQASQKASEKLAETRDRIGDIVDKNRTLEGTPVERLTGSFGLLKESIMNLDFDKARIGAEGLLNTFTPVVDGKLVTGFAGIKGAMSMLGEGFKSLGTTIVSVGKSILANPIFLLAAVIIAVVAAVVIILDKLGLLKKIMDVLMIPINLVIEGFKALTDWLGLTTYALEDNAAAAKKNGEEQRAQIDATATSQKNLAKLTEGMTEAEVEAFRKKAGIKDTLNKSSFDIEKTRLTQTQETLKTEIDALNELQAAGGELTEDQLKDLEERKKAYTSNAAAIKQIELERVKYQIDLSNRIAKSSDDWHIKAMTNEKEKNKAILDGQKVVDLANVDKLLRDAKLNKASAADIAKLVKEKSDIEAYYAQQTTKLNETAAKDAVAAAKTASDKKAEQVKKDFAIKEADLQNEVDKIEKNTQARIDKEKAMENELLEFRKKNLKYFFGETKAANDLFEIQERQTKERQKERQSAFDKGTIELYYKDILAKDNIKIQEATTDKEIYAAKRQLIEDQSKADIALSTGTADEKKLISIKAFNDIKALDDEYTAYKLKQTAIEKETLSTAASFELEQYRNKNILLSLEDNKKILLAKDEGKKKLETLEADKEAELSNTELTGAERLQIEQDYAQKKVLLEQETADKIDEIRKEARDKNLEYLSGALQSASGIFNDITAARKNAMDNQNKAELKGLKSGTQAYDDAKKRQFEAEQKFARNSFNTNKSLQLGIATVTGIQSVLSAFANGMKNPVPLLGPATAAVYAVTAGIVAAANIAKIATSKFGEGTPPDATVATPTAPGGAGGDSAAPTNFSPNQFFGLGQQTANGMPGGQKPIKVYVSEGDIRDVSERVSVIETRAVY